MAFGEIRDTGSQLQHRIWFILPTHRASHMIDKTKQTGVNCTYPASTQGTQ